MADIMGLTLDAERGHGCSIKADLDRLADPEARKEELVLIQAANSKRREADPTLPRLELSVGILDDYSHNDMLVLMRYVPGLFSLPFKDMRANVGKVSVIPSWGSVYSESFDPGFPQSSRRSKCAP